MTRPARIQFLDCPIDAATMDQTIEQCLSWCRAPRAAHTLITVNAAILVMMRSDPKLGEAATAGDLIVADGVSVVWASRAVGTPLPARVAGVDLMTSLLQTASDHALRVFFLGAKQEVVDELLSRCAKLYPGMIVAGARNGYFQPAHPEVIRQIRDSQADILFVGMPTPFKEVWCQAHRAELDVPVILGVGGSFDVLAGFISRAPRWLQRIGMEWSWRLMMEPRKMWKRYLTTNSIFLWLTLREWFRRRLKSEAHKRTSTAP